MLLKTILYKHSRHTFTVSCLRAFLFFTVTLFATASVNALSFDDAPIFSLSEITPPEKNTEIKINQPYFYSSKSDLTLDQIIANKDNLPWQKYDNASLVPTRRDTALWFVFQLKPTSSSSKASLTNVPSKLKTDNWIFMLTWALLEHAQVHTINNVTSEQWSSRPVGINYPVSERYFDSRQFAFPLSTIKNDPITVLVEIRSSNLLTFPGSIMSEESFKKIDVLDTLISGCVVGSLIVMFLYNLSLFVALKERSYLYYSFYIFSVGFYFLAASGLGFNYVWDEFAWLKLKAFSVFSSLSFIMMILFIRHFLQLKVYKRIFVVGNDFFLLLWSIMFALSMTFEGEWVISALTILAIPSCFFGAILAIFLSLRRNIDAKIFMLAWAVFVLGTLIFVSMLYGLLPFNVFTRYVQMLGIILQLVLLSFALSYRINAVKRTREEAQREAFLLTKRVSDERRERLKAQVDALNMQKRMNDNLEREVELRTQQLEATKSKLESMNATLTELSVTDSLSGIYNRRYFDDKFIDECKRAFRNKQPLAVIIADIDHFKPINDNFGHVVGDECIRQTASALKTVARRPSDLLARYGGEEFVLVLPGGNLEEAAQIAENCRIAVEAIDFEHDGQKIYLTVSAGVASWVPSSENSYKELLNAADSALYRAKKTGRNCVQLADQSKIVI